MKVKANDKGIEINGLKDFYPIHIFECGQAFRWNWDGKGYVGIFGTRVARIIWQSGILYIEGVSREEFNPLWTHYLDLNRDYSLIKSRLSRDPTMKKAMEYGHGIRILNQDPWETLISFIISANNHIGRIKSIIEKLSQRYGKKIIWEEKSYYTFPEAKALAYAQEKDLRALGCGYRAPYIQKTAQLVMEGKASIHSLYNASYTKAKESLMQYPGVGPKVADCILLFSLGKRKAFPVDTWVRRVVGELYTEELKRYQDIHDFAEDRFGNFGGYAQQYLFYYARENKIGK